MNSGNNKPKPEAAAEANLFLTARSADVIRLNKLVAEYRRSPSPHLDIEIAELRKRIKLSEKAVKQCDKMNGKEIDSDSPGFDVYRKI